MQAHELFRYFRMPELADFRQYVRTLPTNTLMGFGAFAALTTFWYATRPKALKPPCDLSMQSVEVAVSGGAGLPVGPLARALRKACSTHRSLPITDGGRGPSVGQRDAWGGAGSVAAQSHTRGWFQKSHGTPPLCWARKIP